MRFDSTHYRALGNTGISVSPIGLGTVKLGRNTDVKYPAGFELPSDAEARGLLEAAQALGINLLDTAPAYGNSEERLGALLRGQRDEWVICTKVGESYVNGESVWSFSPDATRASIQRSLRLLKTDHLDAVLVHATGKDVNIIETSGVIETLDSLKRNGDILSFGVSTKTVEGGLLALERSDVAMVEFNLSNQTQLPVIERAAALGKGILVKKALESGHAGSPADAIRSIASRQGVSSIIVGTINAAHLASNVEALLT